MPFFKSNVRETWRVILVSEADIFLSESLRILAERLSQSEIGLPLRQICYYSPPEEVGVFSTEIKLKADKLLSMSVQHTISQQNDFFFIVRSACFTYSVRHHKLATFAALNKVRSTHLPVSSSLISSCF